MKWEAHTRTAQKILADFDAYHFQKYEKDLINGIIYPDSNDPEPHRGREEAIKGNIRKARDRRLEYNPSDSFFYLGMAFHYIQDSWVGMDPDHEDYAKYEKQMDKSTLLGRGDDLFKYQPVHRNRVLTQYKELDKRLSKPLTSIDEMYSLVTTGKPYESTAFLDLNYSYRICYRVAEMVLKPMLKISLDEKLSKLHEEYTEKLEKCEKTEQEALFKMEKELGEPRSGVIAGFENWKLKRNLEIRTKQYEKRKHLDKILKLYKNEATQTAKPFVDWYNVQIPELELPVIPEIPNEQPVEEKQVYPLVLRRENPLIPVS